VNFHDSNVDFVTIAFVYHVVFVLSCKFLSTLLTVSLSMHPSIHPSQTVFWKRLLVAELKHQSAMAAASASSASAADAAEKEKDDVSFVWDDLKEVPVDAAEIEKMFSAAAPAKSAAAPAAAPAGMDLSISSSSGDIVLVFLHLNRTCDCCCCCCFARLS
jgi:hypothetical protein